LRRSLISAGIREKRLKRQRNERINASTLPIAEFKSFRNCAKSSASEQPFREEEERGNESHCENPKERVRLFHEKEGRKKGVYLVLSTAPPHVILLATARGKKERSLPMPSIRAFVELRGEYRLGRKERLRPANLIVKARGAAKEGDAKHRGSLLHRGQKGIGTEPEPFLV